ncbi:MAG: TRAP transporter small permease [Alphaproteobacteria bacterium]|nr:TRAP transporter small permease [Alphaproteobacteria bacterium]
MSAILADAYAKLLDLCGLAAGLTLAVMAAMISLDVLIRNLGIGNFPWLLEVAEYALYLSTFLAAPWVLRLGAHVRVDLILNSVPERVARIMEVVVDVLGAVICLVLVWYGLLAAIDSFAVNARFDKELIVSEWWLLMAIPVSSAMLFVEFLLRLRRAMGGPGPRAAARQEGF